VELLTCGSLGYYGIPKGVRGHSCLTTELKYFKTKE